MVTKRVRSTEDIDRQILDFCDQFDQIVEARFVVSKVNQIAKNLRKSLKEHTRLRQEVTMQRLRAAWGRFMESATSDFSAYVFDLDEEAALLESLFTPFYVESGQFGAVLATERLSRILHREILYRGSRAWVHDNAIRFGRRYARSVSQTTNKAIRAEIMDAIKNGEGIDELMVRVQNVYRSVSTYRSEMISRTEMGRSSEPHIVLVSVIWYPLSVENVRRSIQLSYRRLTDAMNLAHPKSRHITEGWINTRSGILPHYYPRLKKRKQVGCAGLLSVFRS